LIVKKDVIGAQHRWMRKKTAEDLDGFIAVQFAQAAWEREIIRHVPRAANALSAMSIGQS
jgi:hypothetical protein